MQLEPFLVTEIFTFMIIFIRIGSGIMILPGIGETYVSPRFRLLFALMVSLAMTPALAQYMPPIPDSPLALIALIVSEMIIGLFIGFMARYMVAVMHTVGMLISFQSSLASATMFDTTQAGQGSTIGNFLGVTAVVLLFATELHHLMLAGLFDSYTLFPPGMSAPVGDISNYLVRLSADVILTATKLASPIIAVGLMIYLGSGILARLMPTMQVFFVIIPPQIVISFTMLMMIFSGMMLWYLDFVEERLLSFLQ